jgi:hypothetical protein
MIHRCKGGDVRTDSTIHQLDIRINILCQFPWLTGYPSEAYMSEAEATFKDVALSI